MGIKTFETRNSLKNKLRSRNLIFDDSELDKALISYNYFNLFNGLETIFLETASPKSYDKIKLNDFINLYQFDKFIPFLQKILFFTNRYNAVYKQRALYGSCK